jgi:ABC-type Fe3+ transport system permease subunit
MTPFLATAVAFVAFRYGRRVMADPQVRKLLTNVFVIAFAVAVIASVLGAVVNVVAPNDFMHRS